MILNRIEDPRDNLEKAHRLELVRFAHAQGVTEITEHMPAILIRAQLRARGLTNIRIPPRDLGQQNQPGTLTPKSGDKVVELDAMADLARQFQAETLPPSGKQKRYVRLVERPKSKINLLRDQCKALGIHMDRRDRMPDLERKIAEHGKNAPQRNQ